MGIDLPESLESFKQLKPQHVPLAGPSGTLCLGFGQIDPTQ
jgi:hypothetical protein